MNLTYTHHREHQDCGAEQTVKEHRRTDGLGQYHVSRITERQTTFRSPVIQTVFRMDGSIVPADRVFYRCNRCHTTLEEGDKAYVEEDRDVVTDDDGNTHVHTDRTYYCEQCRRHRIVLNNL